MKYVALLRGINAGKNRRIDMKELKLIFESIGCENVSTYINSGNVIFESNLDKIDIQNKIELVLNEKFEFNVPTLVKTKQELEKIADLIPEDWVNDSAQKTDVAFLFSEVDYPEIIDDLPVKKEYMEINYASGIIFWNVTRENYNKSHLNKIISHKIYKLMTVRNVNTVRILNKLLQ